jgi:hypothetical protein
MNLTLSVDDELVERARQVAANQGTSLKDGGSKPFKFNREEIYAERLDRMLKGKNLHRLHPVSFWDALILRAARAGGCSTVLSEELNDGQTFDGVRVENPFA